MYDVRKQKWFYGPNKLFSAEWMSSNYCVLIGIISAKMETYCNTVYYYAY